MLTLLRRGLLVFLAAFPLLSMAAPTPQQVVQGTVDELLSDIKANKAAYKADPQSSTPLSIVSLGRWSMPKASPRA